MDPRGLNRAEASKYLFCQRKCNSVRTIPAQYLLVCLHGMTSSLYPVILLIKLTQFCLKISCLVFLSGGRKTLPLLLLSVLCFWRDWIPRLVWRSKCVKLHRSLRKRCSWTTDPSLEARVLIQMWWTDGRREKTVFMAPILCIGSQLPCSVPKQCIVCATEEEFAWIWQGYSTEVQCFTNPEMLFIRLTQLPVPRQH